MKKVLSWNVLVINNGLYPLTQFTNSNEYVPWKNCFVIHWVGLVVSPILSLVFFWFFLSYILHAKVSTYIRPTVSNLYYSAMHKLHIWVDKELQYFKIKCLWDKTTTCPCNMRILVPGKICVSGSVIIYSRDPLVSYPYKC